jgi:hypothetical protein
MQDQPKSPDHDEKGRRVRINVWYPGLPPSANKIYFKGTMLTSPAREYKEQFKMYVVQNYLHLIGEMPEPNSKYQDPKSGNTVDFETKEPNLIFGLQLIFYMDCLTSWNNPEVYKKHQAKFRFKKVDLSNRIKFIEDCFKYAVDIDDSLTFFSSQMKFHSPEQEGVMITYYVMSPEQVSIPRVIGGTM